jgi:hypothetical protein
LADISLFNEENRHLIRFLFRKVFHMAMHNVDQVTVFYKEFTNYYWNIVSKAVTLEEFSLSKYNPFRVLLKHGPLKEILSRGICTKIEATSVAHLLSTRQLVPGGNSTQVRALDKFEATTGNPFHITDVNRTRADLFSYFVGNKCRELGRTKNMTALCHISVSTAGDVDFPKASGGRGAAVAEDIYRILDEYPAVTQEIHLPFGFVVRDVQAVPRYCTWGRTAPPQVKKFFRYKGSRETHSVVNGYSFCGPSGEQCIGIDCPDCIYLPIAAPHYGFGQPLPMEPAQYTGGKDTGPRLEGWDEFLGLQIFYAALFVAFNEGYIDLEGNPLKPIPAKTSVVPEPGGKARVVTTTKWWVQVLEQPFGHLTKALLSSHPSAEAGLKRADQAWLYLFLLSNAKPIPNAMVLSSDLEEATDAIAPDVAETMIRGFYRGVYGHCPKLIEVGIKIGLRSTREVTIRYPRGSGREPRSFIKTRGVLMGEPVTKSVLTLYSLVCEEAAIRDYLYNFTFSGVSHGYELSLTYLEPGTNLKKKVHVSKKADWQWALCSIATLPKARILRCSYRENFQGHWTPMSHDQLNKLVEVLGTEVPEGYHPDHFNELVAGNYTSLDTYLGPVKVPWRAFAVGGDDHIAYGPKEYLQLITSNHYAFGSKISKPKHGYSNIAVKFCEKILFLKGTDMTIRPADINRSSEMYERSVWVDSIKVRLLSPLTKSMDVDDDRNTAIGKSGGVQRSLAWLNPDYFHPTWCDAVLQRFTSRMYPFLPNPLGSNASLYNVLKLPQELGGLGLARKDERLMDIVQSCPEPTRRFVRLLIDRALGYDIIISESTFSELARATKRLCTANSARGIGKKNLVESIENFLDSKKSYTIGEIRNIVPAKNFRELYSLARQRGYYTREQATEAMLRSTLFKFAMTGQKMESYQTTSWRNRYHHLWEYFSQRLDGLKFKELRPVTFTSEDYDFIHNVKDIKELLPVTFYNMYEATPTLAIVNSHAHYGVNVASAQNFVSKIALQLGKIRFGPEGMQQASIAPPLIEVLTQGTPCLNLRMDFDGNKVPKSVPRSVVPESDPDFEDFISMIWMPASTHSIAEVGEETVL